MEMEVKSEKPNKQNMLSISDRFPKEIYLDRGVSSGKPFDTYYQITCQ